MLKFSKANAKTAKLALVPSLAKYLANGRQVYSLDLLSGFYCPFAKECLSKAVVEADGSRHIEDGEHTKFRCFSASQELVFPVVYNRRKHNSELLRSANGAVVKFALIRDSMPKNLGICRIHVAGDFFNQDYFDAWLQIASDNGDKLFYAYTKSLPFWVRRKYNIPPNFVLTASYGGSADILIQSEGLRYAAVIADPKVCERIMSDGDNIVPNMGTPYDGLPIDHDDSHAADPLQRSQSFALLVHGIQPQGSDSAKSLKILKGKGSYGR